MPTDKDLFNKYFEMKKKLDSLKNNVFPQLRDICELCTCINPNESITDFHFNEEPVYADEPEVIVDVTSYDYGDDTYYFPKRYLNMTPDEIKADVERIKKLDEDEKQRAETDAEYRQYLKLKEKFEKKEG